MLQTLGDFNPPPPPPLLHPLTLSFIHSLPHPVQNPPPLPPLIPLLCVGNTPPHQQPLLFPFYKSPSDLSGGRLRGRNFSDIKVLERERKIEREGDRKRGRGRKQDRERGRGSQLYRHGLYLFIFHCQEVQDGLVSPFSGLTSSSLFHFLCLFVSVSLTFLCMFLSLSLSLYSIFFMLITTT